MASHIGRVVSAWAVVGLVAGAARAQLGELVDRLPAGANAVVAVDVAPVRAAVKRDGEAQRPVVPLPPVVNLQGLVLGAHVQTGSMEPAWQVAVLRVGGKASMPALATASRGYADTLEGRPAAWCANDVFCFSMDDRTIGAVYPADRQFAARWAATAGAGAVNPVAAAGRDYLRAAAGQVKQGVPLVIAMDLKDTVSEAGVMQAFQSGRPQWAAGVKGDEKSVARLLAGVRGVTIRFQSLTADGADGAMTVDFAQDASALGPAAKEMVTGVLSAHGLGVSELDAWTYSAAGKAVSGKGRMSIEGVQRLVSFLSSPGVSAPGEEAAQTAGATKAADSEGGAAQSTAAPGATAAASQRYFKTVSRILESFRAGPSLGDSATWLNRTARQIDQLPADGVDPDLLLWGSDVSSNLRQAAGIFVAAQQRVRARTSGVQTTAAYARRGIDTDPQQAAQARADLENARRQAQQAGAEERAAATEEANKALQAALDSRGKIRATMVSRYGGGF